MSTRRRVIACPKHFDGCGGEVATVILRGQQVTAEGGTQALAMCTTCWAPRLLPPNVTNTLQRVRPPTHVQRAIRDRIKDAEHERMVRARQGAQS